MPGSDETFFLDSRRFLEDEREAKYTYFPRSWIKESNVGRSLKIVKTLINKKEQEEKENAASEGSRVARSSRRASIVEVCTEIGE